MKNDICIAAPWVLALGLLAGPAHATLFVSGQVHASGLGLAQFDDTSQTTAVSGSADKWMSGSGGNASAYANWGVLKVAGQSLDTVVDNAPSLSIATAIWTDKVTFSSTQTFAANASAILHASMLISGDFSHARGSSSADSAQDPWAITSGDLSFSASGCYSNGGGFRVGQTDILNHTGLHRSARFISNNVPRELGSMFGIFEFDISMPIGCARDFGARLQGTSDNSARGGGFASSSFALDHSAYWGGISSVTVDGVAVSDFSLLGASGHDWAKSSIPTGPGDNHVPEPATAWLSLLGLVGLGYGLRKAQG